MNCDYNHYPANFNLTRMTTPVYCFSPIEDSNAHILILGSMPGLVSLTAAQYYAHPRNAFWYIMNQITGASPDTPYEARIEILKCAGIALWDVLASCHRPGSLDADIRSLQANNFESFFRSHPHIERVCFNGAMAEKCYMKAVFPGLATRPIQYLRLPSTSPAHASVSRDQKLTIWRHAIQSEFDPAR